MKTLLRSKGFKLTKNETLKNREFREAEKQFEINQEHSTLGEQVYNITEDWEVFLDDRLYTETKMRGILDATRARSIDEVALLVEKQERGYLITFTTIRIGVT